jgi:hypothetical protein
MAAASARPAASSTSSPESAGLGYAALPVLRSTISTSCPTSCAEVLPRLALPGVRARRGPRQRIAMNVICITLTGSIPF